MLWLFTDAHRLADPRPIVARLPRGLCGVVLRHDGDPDRRRLGQDLARLCRMRRMPLVVAGDTRLALALKAGIHLRAGRWPDAVRPRGRRALRTSSAHDATELRRAEQFFSGSTAASIRVGTGTDAHAFDSHRPLWLAGLFWPGEPGLRGHSDGDVVSHAICDAMLSATRLGDMGSIFGTEKSRFADAHGDVFLRDVNRMVREVGFEVGNVSVQLIGNTPIFSPRRQEAESQLSHILGASVSISATTTDALGFTGRGEGLAAIATVLVHARSVADPDPIA